MKKTIDEMKSESDQKIFQSKTNYKKTNHFRHNALFKFFQKQERFSKMNIAPEQLEVHRNVPLVIVSSPSDGIQVHYKKLILGQN